MHLGSRCHGELAVTMGDSSPCCATYSLVYEKGSREHKGTVRWSWVAEVAATLKSTANTSNCFHPAFESDSCEITPTPGHPHPCPPPLCSSKTLPGWSLGVRLHCSCAFCHIHPMDLHLQNLPTSPVGIPLINLLQGLSHIYSLVPRNILCGASAWGAPLRFNVWVRICLGSESWVPVG